MNDLISFAYDMMSYISLQNFFHKYPIRQIILFGSSVRHDYNKNSDIDIFIDLSRLKSVTKLKKDIEKAIVNFIESDRIKKWNKLNIRNEFSLIFGDIRNKKWSDLRRSMHSHGVILWKRYLDSDKSDIESGVLVKWSTPKNEVNKRINLARKLYGYSQKGKKYRGLFENLGIKPLGDGIAIIPPEHVNTFRKLYNELGVKYILKDILMKR